MQVKLRSAAVIGLFALVVSFAVPAVAATTYYGPSFSTPISIAPGGTISIVLSTGSGTSIVPLPQGSSSPCSGTCTYPQQPWTTATGCFYLVHQVTVTDPNGNGYMLGSATTSGLFWPSAFGGSGSGTHVPPQADALNVTSGDSFTLPFAAGAGGFTFTSVLGNPPNDVSPAGPYYWWTLAGNALYGSNVRIDTQPSINPTLTHGTYVVDIEGAVACPTGATTFTSTLFFDAGSVVTTPQFPTSMALVTVSGFAALLLLRKKLVGTQV